MVVVRTRLGPAIALCAAACGGGELAPGAGDDPGSGTATLAIDGTAYASPRRAGATARSEFDTAFTVHVSAGDQPITTGAVTVTSATGKVSLTFVDDIGWSATAPGYDQVYVLDVVRGGDRLDGARVDGPDIHAIARPAEGAGIDATLPLLVEWRREVPADAAALWFDRGAPTIVPDAGSYTLPGRTLRADKMKSADHALHVLRINAVSPAGAAAGSTWRVAIENTVDVVTPPLPL